MVGSLEKSGIVSQADSRFLDWVRNNEIGREAVLESPFGFRKLCYCDYTGSARSLEDIEKYIKSEVLPFYGNTHSSTTVTSQQSAFFLQEAKDVIRNAVGASEDDAVFFTGNGATAAVELLVHFLQLSEFILICGIQEHHSNLLPWRELCKECFVIEESENGQIDISDLLKVLKDVRGKYGADTTLLGCFTAASNITGVVMNIEEVNSVLIKSNCISIWDYASAAPYINIKMNDSSPKGALFFSGHKFIGGVQTPGVLVVKKKLIKSKSPKRSGGGTVFFVSKSTHSYLKNIEYREEGGTADVVGAVRLALAFKLKASVGIELIAKLEEQIARHVIKSLSDCKNVVLLGPTKWNYRLATFSFLIRDSESDFFFHHNYISALLNDLFGIQSRSGCACAGPYAQHLLGINEELALKYYSCLMEDAGLDRDHLRRREEYTQREMLRPGFTRISLPFFTSSEMVDFVLQAISFVAQNARRFITQYQLNCENGEWHHVRQRVFRSRNWLGFVEFSADGLTVKKNTQLVKKDVPKDIRILLSDAEMLAVEAENAKTEVPDGRAILDLESNMLRWFLLGSEVKETRSGLKMAFAGPPFRPKRYVKYVSNVLAKSVNQAGDTLADDSFSETETKELSVEEICFTGAEGFFKDSVEPIQGQEFSCNTFEARKKSETEDEMLDDSPNCCIEPCQISNPLSEDSWEADEWNQRVVLKRHEDLNKEMLRNLPWVVPNPELYKKVVYAIQSLNMIREGDRILVCLSGGKDSLSLLHCLHFYQERAKQHQKTNFHLGAITVDPCSSGYNPRPLIDYCRSLNIDYFYEIQDIIGQAAKLSKCRSICGYCSRMKRGRLTFAAKLHGYNVLAMGHHLDDLAESFVMAAFQNGNLSTMKAQYTIRKDNLRIIRPLIYVREKSLREFAGKNSLPVIAENCPACFEQPRERHRIKQLLASYELIYPQLFSSLRSALHPLLLVDSAHTSGMRRMAIENICKTYVEREKRKNENIEDLQDSFSKT